MNLSGIARSVGIGTLVAGSGVAAGAGGFVLNQAGSRGVRTEQNRADAQIAELRQLGRGDGRDVRALIERTQDERPGNLSRDFDKFGVASAVGGLSPAGGTLGLVGHLYQQEGRGLATLGKGGIAAAAIAVGGLGLIAGSAVGVGNNLFSDRFAT